MANSIATTSAGGRSSANNTAEPGAFRGAPLQIAWGRLISYKGAQGWTDAEDDRQIGGLWAELSGSKCRFVMVRDRQWQQIEDALR